MRAAYGIETQKNFLFMASCAWNWQALQRADMLCVGWGVNSSCSPPMPPSGASRFLQAALVCLMLSLVLGFRDPQSLHSHVSSTPIPTFSLFPDVWLHLTQLFPRP